VFPFVKLYINFDIIYIFCKYFNTKLEIIIILNLFLKTLKEQYNFKFILFLKFYFIILKVLLFFNN